MLLGEGKNSIISHYKLRRRLTLLSLFMFIGFIFFKVFVVFFLEAVPIKADIENRSAQIAIFPQEEEVEQITYSDKSLTDIKEHWGEAYIKYYWEKDIITSEDGIFRPDDNITKIDYLKLILLAFEIEIPSNYDYDLIFSDVKKTDWYSPITAKSFELGLLKECVEQERKFNGFDPITIAEATKILILASEIDLDSCLLNPDENSDVGEEDPYQAYIAYAKQIKIISDEDDPESSITRAHSCKLVYLMQKYLENNEQ